MITAIAAALAIFITVALAALLIGLVSAGIRREERQLTLTRSAPDRVTQGTRRLTGLYVRSMAPAPDMLRETHLV